MESIFGSMRIATFLSFIFVVVAATFLNNVFNSIRSTR